MIHEAQEELTSREFDNPKQLKDSHGTIGYLVERNNDLYVLVAKAYAYQNLASFMARLVGKADDEVRFIFYCDDDQTFTVFDARHLKENGSPSQGPSKKRDCSWVEIDREEGAELDDYFAGRDRPRTISGDNESLSAF